MTSPELNHEDLLRRYIDHVGRSEGTDFLGPNYLNSDLSGVTFDDAEVAELHRLAGRSAPAAEPAFAHGTIAEATWQGHPIHVRYGTSKLGPEWEVVGGRDGFFGHLPTSDLEDLVVMERPR